MTDILPDPELEALEREYAAEIRRVHAVAPHLEGARVWQRIEQRMLEQSGARERRGEGAQRTRKKTRIGGGFGKHSLSISLVAAASIAVAVFWRRGDIDMPIERHTYATAPGENATVSMEDGTRIVLGPATTAEVVHAGRVNGTTVTVSGQAWFSVARRDKMPFVVRTTNSVTRVLGTSFVVRRYANDPETRVLVLDGRISVSANKTVAHSRAVVLGAKSYGLVPDTGDIRVLSDAMLSVDTAWISGRLEFRQATLGNIVTEIGRAYGTEIRVADSALVGRTVTCTVRLADHSVEAVLDALAASLDAHVVRANHVLTLVPGPATVPMHKRSPHLLPLESQYGR
jgi:ferric-dicitrate binding protein FerR (iron transport regulator)